MSMPSSGSSTWRSASTTSSLLGMPGGYLHSFASPVCGEQHQLDDLVDRPLDIRVLDDRNARTDRPLDQVRLHRADLVDVVEVLVHRPDPAGRRVAYVEVHPVRLLVRDGDDRVHDECPVDVCGHEAGDEVHALEHD